MAMWRAIRLTFGYTGLLLGGLVWFVCFPLTTFTLYTAHQFPFGYFGDPVPEDLALDYWLPQEMRLPLGGVCAGFTLYGLVLIYFNVRRLRKLRLAQD